MAPNSIPSGAAAALASSVSPLSSGASSTAKPGAAGGKTMNAKEAATQFEGLLIEEMLRSAHESNPGSLGGDEEADSQNDTIFDMATQQFAQVMAKQGGFGIAKIVDAGIARQQASIDSKSGDSKSDAVKQSGTAPTAQDLPK